MVVGGHQQDGEDPTSFGFDDDDDDDELANLFSFATAESELLRQSTNNNTQQDTPNALFLHHQGSNNPNYLQDLPLATTNSGTLVDQREPVRIFHGSGTNQHSTKNEADGNAVVAQEGMVEGSNQQPPIQQKTEPPMLTEKQTLALLLSELKTLENAVQSPKANIRVIQTLYEKEGFLVSPVTARPHLWCRIVCDKTLEEILQSNDAESFCEWQRQQQQQSKPLPAVEKQADESAENADASATATPSSVVPPKADGQTLEEWIQQQASALSDRITTALQKDKAESQQQLATLLEYYFHSFGESDDQKSKGDAIMSPPQDCKEPFLPPVACAILSAGVPLPAAAVMLKQIIPHFLPQLSLTKTEREPTTLALHRQFYLLGSYHIPLLVLHLDKYFPDWYMTFPAKGLIPQSCLISHFAGECSTPPLEGSEEDHVSLMTMDPQCILLLWDFILTSGNHALRYFLLLSILKDHASDLVLLTGDELRQKFIKVVTLQLEQLPRESEGVTQWMQNWIVKAQKLWTQTPISVTMRLKKVEDQTVKEALALRKQQAEERLKRKLEAEAKAQQEAIDAERERNAEAARMRLTRARLVAFYRQYNPENENNIDKIMESYEGRYEVLDSRLKKKYGVGFNPALKPKMPAFHRSAQVVTAPTKKSQTTTHNKVNENEIAEKRRKQQLVVKVAALEILPTICKGAKTEVNKVIKLKEGIQLLPNGEGLPPLKFCIVDSRPAETAKDQGRLRGSLSLTPEDVANPDIWKEREDTFKELQGASHIVVMGEGFAAFPNLYGHKVTPGLTECIREDDARNRACAQFFLKMGFPFVSFLDGGFAGAHSFISREGKKHDIRVHDVLESYDPETSIFAQFERVRNSTGREKAQRALQGIFDSSLVALTKNSRRFESLVSEIGDEKQPRMGNMMSRFFGGGSHDESKTDHIKPKEQSSGREQGPAAPPVFRNLFASKPTNETIHTAPQSNDSKPSEQAPEKPATVKVAVAPPPAAVAPEVHAPLSQVAPSEGVNASLNTPVSETGTDPSSEQQDSNKAEDGSLSEEKQEPATSTPMQPESESIVASEANTIVSTDAKEAVIHQQPPPPPPPPQQQSTEQPEQPQEQPIEQSPAKPQQQSAEQPQGQSAEQPQQQQQSAEQPQQQSAEQPQQQSAEQPQEQPIEQSPAQPQQQSAEQPQGQSAEQPQQQQQSAEQPQGQSAEQPQQQQQSAEQPQGQSAEQPQQPQQSTEQPQGQSAEQPQQQQQSTEQPKQLQEQSGEQPQVQQQQQSTEQQPQSTESAKQPTLVRNSSSGQQTAPGTIVELPQSTEPPKPPDSKRHGEQPMNNPFAGFGAALNNSLKAASKVAAGGSGHESQNAANNSNNNNKPGVRNPFARFNVGGVAQLPKLRDSQHGGRALGTSQHGKPGESNVPGIGMARNLAGLNEFRKNAMARIRLGDEQTGEQAADSSNR